jgi:hypothetical protein
MTIKQMVVVPIYWGEWWLLRGPLGLQTTACYEMNGILQTVVGGRYMDCLNQYGIGRGVVSKPYVYPVAPPSSGFTDAMRDYVFDLAINQGHVPTPGNFDLDKQLPFFCLIVKPGIEHLLDPSLAPDMNTGAYHYSKNYWKGGPWPGGQVCWVKGDTTIAGTVQRLLHEMAEAYSGAGEIADKCAGAGPVVVDGVAVPQYWSVADDSCCPEPDSQPSNSPLSEIGVYVAVVKILFGIIGDGGGLALRGRTPVPVDPWGWLTDEELDRAFDRAASVVEQELSGNDHALRQGVEFLTGIKHLIKRGET